MSTNTKTRSEFLDDLVAARRELDDKSGRLHSLGREKKLIIYSYGTRGSDLARQLRVIGVDCLIFDNSESARERARADGFAVTSDLGLDRPLVVAAGQNQLSIMGSLSRPAWPLAEALYAFDLINHYGPARQFSDRLLDCADALYELYRRLDDGCRAAFLDVLLFRASLDVGRIARTRLPMAEMWVPPAAVGSIGSFCDVGAYDGDTLDAMKRTFPDLVATFAVEPNPDMVPLIAAVADQRGLANRSYAGAAWTHAARLNVTTLPSGMMTIREDPTGNVPGDALDHVVGSDRYDYVKFDVEGSEAQALDGARSVLRSARCIAVAAYRKADDLISLPAQLDRLLDTGDEWRCAFAHYSESFDDSILYFYRPATP